jgi:hypothetical protein
MMEPLAQSYLAGRTDAALRVLTAAVTTLRQGGDHGAASSLQNVVNALRGKPTPLSQAAEPLPGLIALVRLAGRERSDPHGMLPGEHVRLNFPDHSGVTGVWCYDEPSDEWPVGRNYVIRDDNGQDYDVRGGGGMQIQPLWLDLDQRDRHEALSRAVTVIASGWAGPRALRGPDHDELITHEHLDHEQPLDPKYVRREQQRRCDCGELATMRAAAWGSIPNELVMLLAKEPYDQASPWSHAEEYASETVCSADCAENWRTSYTAAAADMLGEQAAAELRFDLQPWTYEPTFDDLPGVLAMAQEATGAAAHAIQEAAKAWLNDAFADAAEAMNHARESATIALARIAEAQPVNRGPITFTAGDATPESFAAVTTQAGHQYVHDPIHHVWVPSFPGEGRHATTWAALLEEGDVEADRMPELFPSIGAVHPRDVPVDVWLQMAAPLVAKIQDDPHRYEIIDGGAIVYDRQTNQFLDGRTGLHHPCEWKHVTT